MKIVVLDAYALNPGDLSWEFLEKFGETTVYDRTPAEETLNRIGNAEIVLTNKTVLDRSIISAAPALRYIGVMATGYNVVDVEAAKEKNISVANIPAYSTPSVAQLVFAFILRFANHLEKYTQSVNEGDWIKSKDFSYMVEPIIELQGKTLGIVGFGQIGQAVGRIGLAFGMKVIAVHKHPRRDKMEGVQFLTRPEVFAQADFITLHIPMSSQNAGFVDAKILKTMKKEAVLINTARGGLINEHDLAAALNEGLIRGAALDVLSVEPPTAGNPLLHARNCLITPHIAWASKEARLRLMAILEENISQFIAGSPKNIVN